MDKQELLSTLRNHINKEKEKRENADSDTWISGYGMGRVDALTLGYEKVEQLDEPEQPEIPQWLAGWLEAYDINSVAEFWRNFFMGSIFNSGERAWILANDSLISKAILYGYTVKEPVWVIKDDNLYLKNFSYYDGEVTRSNFKIVSKGDKDVLQYSDKQKAEAVAKLVDGEIEEWSE